jgi:hypothetical protein
MGVVVAIIHLPLVNIRITLFAEAHFVIVIGEAVANAGAFIALWANQHHVRKVERRIKFDDLRWDLTVADLLGLLMLLSIVHALDYHPIIFHQNGHDFAALTQVFAGDHFNSVAFLDPSHTSDFSICLD